MRLPVYSVIHRVLVGSQENLEFVQTCVPGQILRDTEMFSRMLVYLLGP